MTESEETIITFKFTEDERDEVNERISSYNRSGNYFIWFEGESGDQDEPLMIQIIGD